jgi:hypothetical protein
VHAAPAVRVSIGRDPGWVFFVAVAGGAAAANLVAWLWLQLQGNGAGWAAAATGLLAAGVCAARARRGSSGGDLAWDGATWHWRGVAGQARVALDFDGWLLLRFDAPRGPCLWIAASRASTLGPWPALRAALYSKRPADPLDVPPA